jgi:DNA polymerase I
METLLDATYDTVDERAVIKLFYKPEKPSEDKKIVAVRDFEPYFYAIPAGKAEDLVEEIKSSKFPEVKKLDIVERMDFCNKLEVVEIVVGQPMDVPKIRESVANLKKCKETREDDIRFVQRYIIDAGLIPMQGADNKKLRIGTFDIETIGVVGGGDGGRILMISYADTLGLRKVWTYKHSSDLPFVEKTAGEKEMIERFIETLKKQKIDLIVTYNGDNFDFTVMKDRCKDLGILFSLGAEGREVKLERRGMNLGARVIGRPHVDLYPVCRRLFNLPRYTLEDIHLTLFGEEKLDINTDLIGEWWEAGRKEEMKTFFSYSMADSDSTLKIALEVLPTEYELSQLIGQPIFEVARMGTGNAVEWLLMKKAHDEKILIPAKPSDSEAHARRMDSYEGGFVVEPKKGLHDNILVFDFRSLYPSIIISYNIDPSTINCECCEKDAHVAPTGVKFCKKRRGQIPELLEGIIKSRTKAKLELKKLREGGKDKVAEKMLDARQQALKILANSAYGYMGFARARWYNNECASAAAAWGREYIKSTLESAKAEGFNVIYGDTDSLLLTVPGVFDEKSMKKVKNDFLQKINKSLPPAMELEFEGFYPRGVFVTKKRYALVDKDKKLTVRGLETRRRDWANIAKTTQEKVLNAILWDRDTKKAAGIVKAVVKDLRGGNVPLKELTILTQLTKGLSEYQNVGPHVHAAHKAQKRGKPIKPGEMIQYIITKKGSSISEKAEMVGFVKENDYDADYYINNQVLPAVMRIMEAVGFKEDELKGLGRQTTLSGF